MRSQSSVGYIVISNRVIEEVTVLSVTKDFCAVRFTSKDGVTRLRKSRVFATKEEAASGIQGSAFEAIKKIHQ